MNDIIDKHDNALLAMYRVVARAARRRWEEDEARRQVKQAERRAYMLKYNRERNERVKQQRAESKRKRLERNEKHRLAMRGVKKTVKVFREGVRKNPVRAARK